MTSLFHKVRWFQLTAIIGPRSHKFHAIVLIVSANNSFWNPISSLSSVYLNMATANVEKSLPSTSSSNGTASLRTLSTRNRSKPETFTAGGEGGVKTRNKSSNKEIPEVPDIVFPTKKAKQKGM